MDEMQIRLVFLAVGAIIGWTVGMLYSQNRCLKGLQEDLAQTRKSLDLLVGKRDEKGAVNMTFVGMVLALSIVVFSLVSTVSTNARQADIQDDLTSQSQQRDRENACTSGVLFSTVQALNQRTTYSTQQADANIELQKAQAGFLSVILKPGDQGSSEKGKAALTHYFRALTRFTKVASQQRDAQSANPYPTQDDYADCLREARAFDE